ncbi:MAG: calcium-binding protein [Alphaproteobacteria bacterium HGW-Alphaproteobacteria-2]|nr:MAG: calcium-binding protein [Alphaproteobacteria bacterium HGW-Alphaproteobacteria-2]
MKRSTKFALAAVASLGLAAVAAPVIAQQMQQGMGQQGMGQQGGAGMAGGMMGGGMMMGSGVNVMATFDTNKDGALSPEEMAAGIKAELTKYDTDANGALSLDEFAVMQAVRTRPMTVRAFQMHDADGDAEVSAAEMTAVVTMMQSFMAGQQGGMPGMGQGMMGNN